MSGPAAVRTTGYRVLRGLGQLLGYLLGWQLVAATGLLSSSFLGPAAVLSAIRQPGRAELLRTALVATGWSAGIGLLLGMLTGTVSAALVRLLPPLRAGFDSLALLLYTTPPIAVAPLVVAVAPRSVAPIATAAVAVYFPCFVAISAGLAAARPEQRDLVRALGGGRWQQVRRLDAAVALPSLATALQLGAPAAMLGALVGEWFGLDRGLGVIIISAMRNDQTDLLWAAAMTAALTSVVAFAGFSILHRQLAVRYAD